ncbi:MAG TPA: NAD(P)H-hydrate dehydratase, partial [Gammaproteobacteria bacterium]|nr:NAD(P)H-hydrate dehydratase [Gammaproteobacteria bacterium]
MMLLNAPIPVYQTAQIRELEKLAEERFGISSEVLMQRAGKAALECLVRQWPKARKIAVVCGTGNNGGDGYVVARLARERGLTVTVWQIGELRKQKEAAQRAYEACKKANVIIQVTQEQFSITDVDVIVDAISGLGLHSEMRAETRTAIDAIAAAKVPVLAIDLPSGIDADNGRVWGAAVRANVTISFIGLKLGLLTGKGVGYAGNVICHDLQLPTELFSLVNPIAEKLQHAALSAYLKPRTRDLYKNEAGHVLLVGGDHGYTGAIRLAAEAALRVGAGLVSIATRPEHAQMINTNRPEIMCHGVSTATDLRALMARATMIVIGPGLGQSDWAQELLEEVFKSKLPLLVDADGLNLLAKNPIKRDNWVLTPHSGEAARLLQGEKEEIALDRLNALKAMQQKYDGIVVLKGAGTLIQSGNTLATLCPYGNPGMASGGMGDVLSGVIGSLIAQGLPLDVAAKLGVCIHAMAADEAAK